MLLCFECFCRLSAYYTYFTCRNCVCQPSVMAETTVNHSAFAFIVFDFQHWVAKLRLRRRYFQHSKHSVTTPRAGITPDYGRLAEKLALNRFPGPFLVCDLNRTPIVMAKHGDPCVHFSGISSCGRTSRETVSHPQRRQPLPTTYKMALPVNVTVTNKRLKPLTTTL